MTEATFTNDQITAAVLREFLAGIENGERLALRRSVAKLGTPVAFSVLAAFGAYAALRGLGLSIERAVQVIAPVERLSVLNDPPMRLTVAPFWTLSDDGSFFPLPDAYVFSDEVFQPATAAKALVILPLRHIVRLVERRVKALVNATPEAN